jgi:hypothetical protein
LQARFFLGGANVDAAHQSAVGMLYRGIQQQAALLSYADNFRLMSFLALLCIPLVLFFHRAQKRAGSTDVIVE